MQIRPCDFNGLLLKFQAPFLAVEADRSCLRVAFSRLLSLSLSLSNLKLYSRVQDLLSITRQAERWQGMFE